jgi:hypothetical protein
MRAPDDHSLAHFANCIRGVLRLDPIPFTENHQQSDEERFYVEPAAAAWADFTVANGAP